MAYNGSHQNADTEDFLAKTELECEWKHDINLDYVDDWFNVDVNVQNEIWRGKKLREKKPKSDETANKCIVPNINFFEYYVNQPRVRKGHPETFKNSISQSTNQSRCSCTRTTSAASSYLMINRIPRPNTIQTKAKKGKRCPMRIAELAVPTKRQCIETWRNKSDVLPEFMVERLKQHVMDQQPIVKIPEAIYCFQNGRRVSSKKWLSSKHEPNKTRRSSQEIDARMFCIIFAHKIAKRLAKPINFTFNSDLEKLSTIVCSDISKIMSKCQCTTTKRRQYKAIQRDVSNKITVWITGILEDLSCKLLEEDLKVKMEIEAQIKTMLEFSERVVTIIETIIAQENFMKSKDLEDEEGPVLDFIDDVVENVMNICEPPDLHIDSDSDLPGSSKDLLLGEESEKPDEPIESSDSKISKFEEIVNSGTSTQVLTEIIDDGLTDSNETLMDSEYFRNEISNIIDYIINNESGDDISNGSGDDKETGSRDSIENQEFSTSAEMEHNTNDDNNEEISPEAGIEHDVNEGILPEAGLEHDLNEGILPEAGLEHDLNEGILPEAGLEYDLNEGILPEAELEHDVIDKNNEENLAEAEKKQGIKDENNVGIWHETNEENFDQFIENAPNVDQNDEASENAAETHSNVSERFEIFTGDFGGDKNSKKVMFPKKELVNPNNPAEHIKTSTAEEPAPEPDKHKQVQWNRQNNKSNIMFAEPNQNLLSDADESWPADLGNKPMLKVSEKASKSVTSLGRITENDEKQMSSPEDESSSSMTDKGVDDTILQENYFMEKLDNMLPTEKHDKASQSNEPQIKVYLKTIIPEPGESRVVSKILDEKYFDKTISVPKTCDDKSFDESSKPEKYQTDSGESEIIRTGSQTGRTEDDKISISHNTQSQVDYGWRVHPKTAPSWVISWGQGRGEPSEESIPIQIRPIKVSEIELRKWCKELGKAFTNLEMWRNWISATCKESLFVLQQKELNCLALTQKGAINWIRLKKNVHKDALLWTKMYQRTDKNFKSLKKKYINIEFSSNQVPSVLNRTIFKKMREFEELSVKLHKMIVAAEYCAMCTCDKTKSRYHSNKEYLGYRTRK